MLHRVLAVFFAITLLAVTAAKVQPQSAASTCFGSDAGAASTDWAGHSAWAQRHSVADVESNLEAKASSVFQCDALPDSRLAEAFSELSVVIGQYVSDAACFGGDAGAASTNRDGHYTWASQRTRQQILANLLWKLQSAARCVDGARFSSYFADLSVILAHYGSGFAEAPAPGCNDQNASNSAKIAACTQVIQSGVTGAALEAAYYIRGTSYLNEGQLDPALSDFDQAISLDPQDMHAYNNRGVAYDDKGQYDKAFADLTRAISLDPKYAYAYNNRGNAYSNKGEFDKAIADYTQALSLDPKDAYAFNNRGNAYRKSGDYDKAIGDFTQAISIDAKYAHAYYNRGLASSDKGEYDKAIADLTKAIFLDPKSPYAYESRGDAYSRKYDYNKAIADFTQAIALDPKDAYAYSMRGYAYDVNRQYDKAIADCTQAISLDANYADAYDTRGLAYDGKGEHDKAIANFTKAISLDPSNAYGYRHRGAAYLATASFAAAANDFIRAVSLAPKSDYPVLWLHIVRMKSGKDDASELAANAARLSPSAWPMPILKFYLGKSTPETAVAAATDDAQRCEAAFYVAEWRLAKKQTESARKLFQQTITVCPKSYVELWAAREELSHLSH